MQTVYTSLQTDNHTNTSSLNFYRRDAQKVQQQCQTNQQCQISKGTDPTNYSLAVYAERRQNIILATWYENPFPFVMPSRHRRLIKEDGRRDGVLLNPTLNEPNEPPGFATVVRA